MLTATNSRLEEMEGSMESALAGHNARLHILERERAEINRSLVALNNTISTLAPAVNSLRDLMSAWSRSRDDGK